MKFFLLFDEKISQQPNDEFFCLATKIWRLYCKMPKIRDSKKILCTMPIDEKNVVPSTCFLFSMGSGRLRETLAWCVSSTWPMGDNKYGTKFIHLKNGHKFWLPQMLKVCFSHQKFTSLPWRTPPLNTPWPSHLCSPMPPDKINLVGERLWVCLLGHWVIRYDCETCFRYAGKVNKSFVSVFARSWYYYLTISRQAWYECKLRK